MSLDLSLSDRTRHVHVVPEDSRDEMPFSSAGGGLQSWWFSGRMILAPAVRASPDVLGQIVDADASGRMNSLQLPSTLNRQYHVRGGAEKYIPLPMLHKV